ncbi:MAG: ribosomal protein S18-alanine N-acetyltransferase [Microbacteriaceae bacterium]|nr:ribosomal protein S18-alanine N-acetyltransferase [Microbacteriaceae bacterium]
MTWSQRRATLDDLDELMALETEIYPDDAWSREIMAGELGNEHGYYLVALADDGAVDAYAGLLAPIGTGQGDIQTVSVAPRARRRGLARSMVLQLLNEARRRGVEELFLEVRVGNEPAETLYRELGFEDLAVRPNYYGPGADARTMRLIVPPARTAPAGG